MPDIVTLTINPAIDIFVNVPRSSRRAKLRCSPPKRDPGGGGINVARVAHRLGGDVTAIYPIGGAIGKLLQRLVEREDIASLVTPSHVETRENFTAYETIDRRAISLRAAGLAAASRRMGSGASTGWRRCRSKPKFVVASGSVPPGVPKDFFARVVRRRQGARRQDRDRHVGRGARSGAR